MSALTDLGGNAALTVAALLPIINPAGSAAIFLSVTPDVSAEVRTVLAGRIARNALALLVAALFVGSYVLSFFGISLSVVKIAGGLVLTATGWRLTDESNDPPARAPSHAPLTVADFMDRTFAPLTFPLTIGPGSLSVAVTLGARASTPGRVLPEIAGMVVGLVLVAGATYVCYRFASPVLRALGTTGTVVVQRLSAFILLAIGIQIFCDGIAGQFGLTMP